MDNNKKDKGKLLAHDIEIFYETEAWKVANAIEADDTEKIKTIINEKPELLSFRENYFGQSLLEWAVYIDRFQAVKVLLELGADPNLQSNDGTCAIINAANKRNTSKYLKLILNFGGDPNIIATPIEGYEGRIQQLKTPLIAAAGSRLESVKLLVESGADINFVDEENQSALLKACIFSKIKIVQYLIEQGADINRPLSYRINGDTVYIHEWLRHFRFDLDSEEYKTKMEVVETLKKRGFDYRETKIPKYLYNVHSEDYLEKY